MTNGSGNTPHKPRTGKTFQPPKTDGEAGAFRAEARRNLKLALFCTCFFCLAALAGLILLFLDGSERAAAAPAVITVSVLVLIVLYLVLRQLLRPLLQLHADMGRFRNTGIRMSAAPQGQKVIRDLHEAWVEMVDTMRDEEARLTAVNQDNQAKNAFLSKISAEMRPPMAQIEEATNNLLESNLSDAQNASAARGRDAGRELAGLADAILDYSKVESGKVKLDNYPFRLDDVLRELAALYQGACADKGLNLVYAVPPDIPQELVGDRNRFFQVLKNIMDNAFKFTESGEIFLGCTLEEKKLRQTSLRFIVRDTGLGMTPEEMSWLFTAFSGAGHERENAGSGLGLGLAISRKLVQLMGGDINIRSVQGRGTSVSFSVNFSLYDSGRDKAWEGAENLRNLRVLVADDSPSNRLAAYDLLKNWVQRVDAAEEAAQAEQMATEAQAAGEPYNIALVSQNLQTDRAFALIRTLAGIRRQAETEAAGASDSNATGGQRREKQAVILMGICDEPDISVMENYDICAFLQKPLTSTALLATLLKAAAECTAEESENGKNTAPEVLKPDFTGYHLLLVEDNPINEQIAAEILLDLGVTLEVAHTGREALKALQMAEASGRQPNPFDLVLMDIQMPEMDGVAATRIIRQNRQYDNIPVVAMTAHVMRRELENYMAAGMNGHIAKPIDIDRLYSELGRFLKNRQTPEL